MKRTRIGAAAIAVLLAGYIYATPYITVYQMNKALWSPEGEAILEYVDLPALRQSLKDEMNVRLAREAAKETEANPFGVLGAALAGMMVERLVDAYVTPSGLRGLMKAQEPNSKQENGNSGGQPSPLAKSSKYESFGKFSVTIRNEVSNAEIKLVLRRRGIGWKLTEMILPE